MALAATSNSAQIGAAEVLYFELETFLDHWRRHGMPEDVVRAALERARRASLAMENVSQRLKGR